MRLKAKQSQRKVIGYLLVYAMLITVPQAIDIIYPSIFITLVTVLCLYIELLDCFRVLPNSVVGLNVDPTGQMELELKKGPESVTLEKVYLCTDFLVSFSVLNESNKSISCHFFRSEMSDDDWRSLYLYMKENRGGTSKE